MYELRFEERKPVYVLADIQDIISYLRCQWKQRNQAFRELRARGVDTDIALAMSKHG